MNNYNEGYKTRWKLKGKKWSLYLTEFVNAKNEWKIQIKPKPTQLIDIHYDIFPGGGGIKKP